MLGYVVIQDDGTQTRVGNYNEAYYENKQEGLEMVEGICNLILVDLSKIPEEAILYRGETI